MTRRNKRIGRSAVGVGIPMGIPIGMGMGIEIPSPRQPCESATGFLCRRTASTEHAADTAEAAAAILSSPTDDISAPVCLWTPGNRLMRVLAVMRPRSSSRWRNTNKLTSVTVTDALSGQLVAWGTCLAV